MKRLKLLFTIVLVIGVSAMAFAQGRGQSPSRAQSSRYSRCKADMPGWELTCC